MSLSNALLQPPSFCRWPLNPGIDARGRGRKQESREHNALLWWQLFVRWPCWYSVHSSHVLALSSPSPVLPQPPPLLLLLLHRHLLFTPPPSHPHTPACTRWFHAGTRWLITLKGFVALSRACVLKTYFSLTNCGGIKADLWGFKRSQEGRVWNPLSVLLQSGYISSYAAFHTTLQLRDFLFFIFNEGLLHLPFLKEGVRTAVLRSSDSLK